MFKLYVPRPSIDRSRSTPSQMALGSSPGHMLTAAESPPRELFWVILIYMTSQFRIFQG